MMRNSRVADSDHNSFLYNVLSWFFVMELAVLSFAKPLFLWPDDQDQYCREIPFSPQTVCQFCTWQNSD